MIIIHINEKLLKEPLASIDSISHPHLVLAIFRTQRRKFTDQKQFSCYANEEKRHRRVKSSTITAAAMEKVIILFSAVLLLSKGVFFSKTCPYLVLIFTSEISVNSKRPNCDEILDKSNGFPNPYTPSPFEVNRCLGKVYIVYTAVIQHGCK